MRVEFGFKSRIQQGGKKVAFIRIRYIKTITINTHIDCLNNIKCSIRDILLATNQGAFESVFGTFSVRLTVSGFS